MSIRKRHKSQSNKNGLTLLYYISIGLVLLWLAASIFFKSNPIDLIKKITSNFSDNTEAPVEGNMSEDNLLLSPKDSLILQLKDELAICRGEKDYHKAMVMINSSYLNLRDQASLNSDVVLQIPAGSIVDIMYFDKQTYFLEGKKGNWARVLYAGKEGWVWGNYLEKLEEDDPALDSLSIN